jgi:hypothetical protein
MPADLSNPFGPSCCDGGECNIAQSAQVCGCDYGAEHLCARHTFKAPLFALIQSWRRSAKAALKSAEHKAEEIEAETLNRCALELEALL